jgi:hypothetical protein
VNDLLELALIRLEDGTITPGKQKRRIHKVEPAENFNAHQQVSQLHFVALNHLDDDTFPIELVMSQGYRTARAMVIGIEDTVVIIVNHGFRRRQRQKHDGFVEPDFCLWRASRSSVSCCFFVQVRERKYVR